MHTADFHLVVLEDSDAIAFQVRTYLEGLPLIPHPVKTIAEAMRLVREYSIDCCLADFKLAASGETAEQFCQALVQEFGPAGLPVVAMSSDLRALHSLNAAFPFVFSVLPKPFTREAITQVFSKLLSELRAVRAREGVAEPAVATVEAVPVGASVVPMNGEGMGRSEEFRAGLPAPSPFSVQGGALSGDGPGDAEDDALGDDLRKLAAGATLDSAPDETADGDEASDDGPGDLSPEVPDPAHEEAVVRPIRPSIRPTIPRPPASSALPRLLPPANLALPRPPEPKAVPTLIRPHALNGAHPKSAPTAAAQDSAASVSAETLLHMPISLVGATGPLVEHVLNLTRVRRCRALILVAADGATTRAWVDQGRFAGFSSTSVPARFRPTGIAPDLAAVLVAHQQLTLEPVAAIAGTPETFEAYQRYCHAEMLAMFSGIVSAVIVRDIPAWCSYPDVGP